MTKEKATPFSLTLLGETIKDLRIEKRIKQKELAEMIHIAIGYLSQIETGKKTPGWDVMDRIAFALDVPVEHLIMKAGLEKKFGEDKKLLYRELKPFFQKFEKIIEEIYKTS